MGDRIAVMNDGRLEQVGTPEELYERPANRFVAGFIGSPSMSFFTRLDRGGVERCRSNGAIVGVRPEHVRPWRDGLIGPLRGRVAFVEALGRETFVGVDVGEARLVVFEEGRAVRDVGDEIEFGLVESGLRYFDAGHAERRCDLLRLQPVGRRLRAWTPTATSTGRTPPRSIHAYWNERPARDRAQRLRPQAVGDDELLGRRRRADSPPVDLEFAEAWQATPTIVVSRTLRERRGRRARARRQRGAPTATARCRSAAPTLAAAMFDRIDEFWRDRVPDRGRRRHAVLPRGRAAEARS